MVRQRELRNAKFTERVDLFLRVGPSHAHGQRRALTSTQANTDLGSCPERTRWSMYAHEWNSKNRTQGSGQKRKRAARAPRGWICDFSHLPLSLMARSQIQTFNFTRRSSPASSRAAMYRSKSSSSSPSRSPLSCSGGPRGCSSSSSSSAGASHVDLVHPARALCPCPRRPRRRRPSYQHLVLRRIRDDVGAGSPPGSTTMVCACRS